MKKTFFTSVFLASAIFILNTSLSIANEPIKGGVSASVASYAPQWEEICPAKYVHTIKAKPPNMLVDVLLTCSLVFLPLSMEHTTDYGCQVYWVERHKEFNKSIQNCLANESTILSCFDKVRKDEAEKTASWNTLQAQMAMQNAQIMMQAANTFQTQMMSIPAQQANVYNVAAPVQNVVNSSNNAQLRAQSCQNRCESARVSCRSGVQSAPTFGNDMSVSRSSHLAQCELNYSRCVARCSY
jgi:hypothetical protein